MTLMADPTLRLGSAELLSKWGFNDGDIPDGFLDWCDEHGYPEAYDVDWHAVLKLLVTERLLPALDARVLPSAVAVDVPYPEVLAYCHRVQAAP